MSKPTIIFIHGMRGTHHGLVDVARHLRQSYNVLLPDLPGSGTRAALRNQTTAGYADWLHQYITAQKLPQKPIIVAHSMGSIIVSNFLKKYPDDVDSRLIYLAPVFRDTANYRRSRRAYRFAKVSLSLPPRRFSYAFERSRLLSFFISHLLVADKSQQTRIDRLHYRYSGRFASHQSFMSDVAIAMLESTWLSDTRPTLVIFGQQDALTPYQYAQECCKKHNNIQFKLLSDTGHLLNYERPVAVAQLISDFLRASSTDS